MGSRKELGGPCKERQKACNRTLSMVHNNEKLFPGVCPLERSTTHIEWQQDCLCTLIYIYIYGPGMISILTGGTTTRSGWAHKT